MKVNINKITKRERDTLVLIGQNRKNKFPLRVSSAAKELKVSMPTVEEIADRLVSKGLVFKNGGLLVLSEIGSEYYTETMMKHRAMETFLTDCGVDPDMACKQVSEFDYLLDEKSAVKIMKKLGNPERCPHGYKIIEK